VVGVVVGEADGVDVLEAQPLLPQGDLGALAAVDEQAVTIAAQQQAGEPALRQGHHPAAAQQTNFQHLLTPSFFLIPRHYLIFFGVAQVPPCAIPPLHKSLELW
jgi:hypothetical protein